MHHLALINNPIREIFLSEVIEVDFVGVDNFLASSWAAPIFEDPHKDKRLIMEPVQDKLLEYCHGESQGFQLKEEILGY
jgi:hypothetical protein